MPRRFEKPHEDNIECKKKDTGHNQQFVGNTCYSDGCTSKERDTDI